MPYPPGPYPPAPPKSRRGLVIGLILGGVLLLVCCVGGLVAFGGLLYGGYQIDKSDTVSALRDYLDDVRNENYGAAYDQLCEAATAELTLEEYEAISTDRPRLLGYDIGDASMAYRDDDDGYDVDVTVRYEGGETRAETYFVYRKLSDFDRYYICPPDI